MQKSERLKKQKDFDLVFKKGKKIYSNSLTLLYLPSSELKVGFAVGKKHGSSVKRNRIKRLLREVFSKNYVQKENKFFFVLIPKIREEYNYFSFEKDFKFLLKKGGIN